MSGKRKRINARPVLVSTGDNGPSVYIDDWDNVSYSVVQKKNMSDLFVVEIGLRNRSDPLRLENLTLEEKQAFCDAYVSVVRQMTPDPDKG